MSTNFLISFQEGDKIKASETNHNNQYLLDEIKTQVTQLDAYLKQELAKFERNLYMVGDIKSSASDTPDDNWMECGGAELSREEYSELYGKIGTTFGEGNKVTTFNLPDLRGVVIRGFDNGRGLDTDRTFGSYQEDGVPDLVGSLGVRPVNNGVYPDGKLFKYNGAWYSGTSEDPGGGVNGVDFKASGYSSVYKTGLQEARVKNIALKYYIKVK